MSKGAGKSKKLKTQSFKTLKKKIGKRFIARNQIKTPVHVKPIKVLEQKALTRAVEADKCVTTRKLSLADLITQTKHYNDHVRVGAFQGIQELLKKFGKELCPSLGHLLSSVAWCVTDTSSHVRREYLNVLEKILVLLSHEAQDDPKHRENVGEAPIQFLMPFKQKLGLQLSSCITHRDAAIRHEALGFLELLLSCGVVSIEAIRQIILSSPQYVERIQNDPQNATLFFFSLVQLCSDLYDQCSFQTMDVHRLVDLYAITQMSLLLLGLGDPGECSQVNDIFSCVSSHYSVSLADWVNRRRLLGLNQLNLSSDTTQSFSFSCMKRFLFLCLSILDQLKDICVTSPELKFSSRSQGCKDRLTLFVLSHLKQVLHKVSPGKRNRQAHDGVHYAQEPPELLLLQSLLPLLLRRDILYMLTQVLKITTWRCSANDGGWKDDQESASPHLLASMRKEPINSLNRNLVQRLITSVFVGIGLGGEFPGRHDRLEPCVSKAIHLHTQLIVIEGFGWFLDGVFPLQCFRLNSVILSVGCMSQYALMLPHLISCPFDFPHLFRQTLSTFMSFLYLTATQLYRETSLVHQFLEMIIRYSVKNDRILDRSLREAIHYFSPYSSSSHGVSTCSWHHGSDLTYGEEKKSHRMTSHSRPELHKNMIDMILSLLPDIHVGSLVETAQQQMFCTLCEVFKAITDQNGSGPRMDTATQHSIIQPSDYQGAMLNSLPTGVAKKETCSALFFPLTFLMVFGFLFKFSVDVSWLESIVSNIRIIPWAQALIESLHQRLHSGFTRPIGRFPYVIVHSPELFLWIRQFFDFAFNLHKKGIDCHGMFCILLNFFKSLSTLGVESSTQKIDQLQLQELFKSLSLYVKENCFAICYASEGNSLFVSLPCESQITLFNIWRFLDSMVIAQQDSILNYRLFKEFIQQMALKNKLSTDLVSYMENSFTNSIALYDS